MTVKSYLQQVCSALHDYSPTAQRIIITKFYEGWSVARTIIHLRGF